MGLEKIEVFRKEKGLTQKELSNLSGVPLGTLTKITTGETLDPKLETVKAIARALKCTLDDLDDFESEITNKEKEISNTITKAEKANALELLKGFQQLNELGQRLILNQLDYALKEPIYKKRDALTSVEFSQEVGINNN